LRSGYNVWEVVLRSGHCARETASRPHAKTTASGALLLCAVLAALLGVQKKKRDFNFPSGKLPSFTPWKTKVFRCLAKLCFARWLSSLKKGPISA